MVVSGFSINSFFILAVSACVALFNPVSAGGKPESTLYAGTEKLAEAEAPLKTIGRDVDAAAKLLQALELSELPAAGSIAAALIGLEHALWRLAESLVSAEASLSGLGDWRAEATLAAWFRRLQGRRDRLVRDSAGAVSALLQAASDFAASPERRDTMALLRIECAYDCVDGLARELRVAATGAERFCETVAALPATATPVQVTASLPGIDRQIAAYRRNMRTLDEAHDSMTHLARGCPVGRTGGGGDLRQTGRLVVPAALGADCRGALRVSRQASRPDRFSENRRDVATPNRRGRLPFVGRRWGAPRGCFFPRAAPKQVRAYWDSL